VDTTSFSVTGEYAADLDAHTLAVTYGFSRDHRADLKQWMLALATTRAGDVPLFCQALDGNASDKVSLLAAVEALAEQLRPANAGGVAGAGRLDRHAAARPQLALPLGTAAAVLDALVALLAHVARSLPLEAPASPT
jgi:hypothetical protein